MLRLESAKGLAVFVVLFCSLTPSCGKRSKTTAAGPLAAKPIDSLNPNGGLPSKLALLIGINDYRFLNDLDGTINDVDAMADLLVKSFHFPARNVRVLKDAEATRKGILSAFRELIAQAGPATITVVHYSGHGSRIRDASGDELDGYDETLVPQDSGRGDHENRDISDDELNVLLRQLIQKTPHVTVVLDSCFSGSALKASGLARTVPPDDRMRPSAETPHPSRSRAVSDGESGFRPSDASYVLISASADYEQAYEVSRESRTFGALTWHLVQEIRQAGAEATYRDIMDLVRSQVTALYPSQHPQLEGGRSHNLVFGDRSLVPKPYVLAFPHSSRSARLDAGHIHGLSAGSVFEVFRPGTKDFESAQPIGKIRVREVGTVTSVAEIRQGKVEKASRAVEREHSYADLVLNVHYERPQNHSELQRLMKRLATLKYVRRLQEPKGYDLLIRQEQGYFVIEAGEPSKSSPRVPVADEDSIERVTAIVKKWGRWLNVLSLSNPASNLAIDLQIEGPSESGREVDRTFRDLDLTFFEGDRLRVRITNNSAKDLYFGLLDVSSDGSIAVYPRNQAHEKLASGNSWTLRLRTTLPEGRDSVRDVLKAIATTEETDFSFLIQEPMRGRREDLNPLQQLLAYAAYGETKGTELVETGDWATADKAFQVQKR